MRLAASGAPVALKRRAVEPINKGKNFPAEAPPVYRLATDWTTGANLSLLHSVKIGSEAHPASYAMSTKDSIPGVKRPGGVKLHLATRSRTVG
jgi:hypothetical protein